MQGLLKTSRLQKIVSFEGVQVYPHTRLLAFLAATPNLRIDFHVTLAIDLAVVEK